MEMFLMAAIMSVLGVAICAALFAAATHDQATPVARPAEQPAIDAPRFFASAPTGAPVAKPAETERELVPVDALLLQIEQHIRLEQAAAESFLQTPTGRSLHSPTTSPLVN